MKWIVFSKGSLGIVYEEEEMHVLGNQRMEYVVENFSFG